jgi:flagellar protein FlgJ
MAIEDYGSRLAADVRSLEDLKARARNNPREALKGATQQFEAYFVQLMLKSMRETLGQDGLLDNDQTRFYTKMMDQQMSQQLGAKGSLGFARLLEGQLGQSLPETSAGNGLTSLPQRPIAPAVERILREWRPTSAGAVAAKPGVAGTASSPDAMTPRDFVSGVWPHAVEASATTGLPPHLVVAHAALESGWGRSEPRRPDGTSSHNLFGIKAGTGWTGPVVEATTTEYVNGKPESRVERFRAYGSYREAFVDYANLLSNSPRYSGVLAAADGTDFAKSLQQSGYATDPMYADKLVRILNGKTLRDALFG